jgi:cytidylate kinase
MVAKTLKKKPGIIISGWPAVGKTTMAVELAKEFDLRTYSGGDILKMLAEIRGYSTSGDDWWDTEEAKEFMQERRSNPSFDRQVDRKLIEIMKSQGAVVTSYTLPWLVEDAIKFWLKGSQDNRAGGWQIETIYRIALRKKLYKFEISKIGVSTAICIILTSAKTYRYSISVSILIC